MLFLCCGRRGDGGLKLEFGLEGLESDQTTAGEQGCWQARDGCHRRSLALDGKTGSSPRNLNPHVASDSDFSGIVSLVYGRRRAKEIPPEHRTSSLFFQPCVTSLA